MKSTLLPVVAWACATSNRVSKRKRPDWPNAIELVRREDAQYLEGLDNELSDTKVLVDILQKRNAELELELAKARASRDQIKVKYGLVSDWMIKHVRLCVKEGKIVSATVNTEPHQESGK